MPALEALAAAAPVLVWWVAAGAALIALLLLLPLSFRFRVAYRGAGREEKALLEFSALGGVGVWRFVLPLVRRTGRREAPDLRVLFERAVGPGYRETRREAEKQETRFGLKAIWESLRLSYQAGGPLLRWGLYLTRKTYWRKLEWETTLSLEDAAGTALLAGSLWALKAQLAAVARQKLRLAPGQPVYRVTPGFNQEGTATRLDGIGAVSLGHIMLAFFGLSLGLVRRWTARRKSRASDTGRGRRAWPNIPFRV